MINGRDPEIPGFEILNIIDDDRHPVFLARDADGNNVAIKILDRAKEPVLPRRFDRKRRTLLRLSEEQDGIATLLASGVSPSGQEYLVSPYYPIGSLQDQLNHGPMPWHPAATMVAKVSDILAVLHAEEIALGGLQPAAILLEEVDKPVLAALGLPTRRFDNGLPIFAAPEAEHEKPNLVPPSDVYSLALILGALVVGRAKGREEPVAEFLAEVSQLVPARILDVIEHGLATSPTNRYRDGATLKRAIDAAMEAPPDELPVGASADPNFEL